MQTRTKHVLKTLSGVERVAYSRDSFISIIEDIDNLGKLLEVLNTLEDEEYTKVTVKVFDTEIDKKPMSMVFITNGKNVGGYKIYEGGEITSLEVRTYD